MRSTHCQCTIMPDSRRTVSDLSTLQLRDFLLTRLHATAAVDAWGADREGLLEIAAENGFHELTPSDLEEIGPPMERASSTSSSRRRSEREAQQRVARFRAERQLEQRNSQRKLLAQVVVCVVVALIQASRQRGAPPLPPCPEPRWWQRPVPWLRPGAKGECRRPNMQASTASRWHLQTLLGLERRVRSPSP